MNAESTLAAAAVNDAATAELMPRIGALWTAQGGIYLGALPSGDADGDWHIILATDPRAELVGQAWGSYGTKIPGADSFSDGPANTRAMAEAGSALAKAMLALDIEGHADWYLMSSNEARLAFIAARDQFDHGAWYWTSTQYSAHTAWFQHFDGGDQLNDVKVCEGRARAVRRFKLSA